MWRVTHMCRDSSRNSFTSASLTVMTLAYHYSPFPKRRRNVNWYPPSLSQVSSKKAHWKRDFWIPISIPMTISRLIFLGSGFRMNHTRQPHVGTHVMTHSHQHHQFNVMAHAMIRPYQNHWIYVPLLVKSSVSSSTSLSVARSLSLSLFLSFSLCLSLSLSIPLLLH